MSRKRANLDIDRRYAIDGACVYCGRALRTAASIARGYGPSCGRRRLAAIARLEAAEGPPGSRLLFPKTDAALVKAAKQEVKK